MEQLQVTILILIDGFLQSGIPSGIKHTDISHNPYFNRWFSAIRVYYPSQILISLSQSLF
mgnify:CR=1 FL=1